MNAPPVQYVKTSDGYDIAYSVCGQGRPVLVTWPPLFGSTEQVWRWPTTRALFESIASRFKLIQYDIRGTGNSTRGLKPDHSQQHYDLDLEAVIDHTGLEDLVLFGLVYTAHTSIIYAARHPEGVAGLILWNPSPADEAWASMKNWESMYTNAWDLFLASFAQTFIPEGPQESLAYVRQTTTQPDFLLAARALAGSRIAQLLPSIRTPTLVMTTREAAWPGTVDAAKSYASLMPNTRLVLFDEPRMEAIFSDNSGAPPVAPVIEQFVNGLPPAGLNGQEPVPRDGLPNNLSERELEVLRLLAAGRSNQRIADELVISINTVNRHVSNIFDKTGAG